MTGEGSNTDRGRGGRKERGTWRKVSFVTIKQNDTTGLLITTTSCWLSVRRSAVLQHKCCPVCIHRVLLRQWCSFQHNWQCNTSRGSDLNPGSVQLLLGLGRTGTGSRERKAVCNNVLTHLLSELSSDVAQSFFAVETEGIESPIAKHLNHLGIFCTHTRREGECGLVNE